MFSCEYYEVFKNTYFEKHLQTVASFDQYFHVCLKSSGNVGSIEYFLLKKFIELLPLVMGSARDRKFHMTNLRHECLFLLSFYQFVSSFKKKTELRALL